MKPAEASWTKLDYNLQLVARGSLGLIPQVVVVR